MSTEAEERGRHRYGIVSKLLGSIFGVSVQEANEMVRYPCMGRRAKAGLLELKCC